MSRVRGSQLRAESHSNVQNRLAMHPRFHMHFTPTSASWLNVVERFVRDINENRLRRGVITSVRDLTRAITEYIAVHNEMPKRSSGP